MRLMFYYGCLFYFIVGIIHVCIGSLIPSLIQYYGKTPDQLGVLIFFNLRVFIWCSKFTHTSKKVSLF